MLDYRILVDSIWSQDPGCEFRVAGYELRVE